MPNTQSAKKALRQNKKRRLRNRAQRSTLRTLIKKVRSASEAEDPQARDAAIRLAAKKLDQAAAKHLLHRNTASRLKSRLSRLLAKPRPEDAAPQGESTPSGGA